MAPRSELLPIPVPVLWYVLVEWSVVYVQYCDQFVNDRL